MFDRRSFPARFQRVALALSMALLSGLPTVVLADPVAVPRAPLRDGSRAVGSPRLVVPALEQDAAGGSIANPFASGKAAVPSATGQTLVAPVTVNANTSVDAMTVNQTGSGRAISGVISNAKSSISALKGTSNGSGAALAGQNTGTTGSAAQLQITNASSGQPAMTASTTGTGNAIQAIQGYTGGSNTPAVLGQHLNGPDGYGIGVEGDGKYVGVMGVSTKNGMGVYGVSDSGPGIAGTSNTFSGVSGESEDGFGVYGYSDTGSGIVGNSNTGYAGYFFGSVYATGTIFAENYSTTSDRNVKEAISPVDTESVLDRIGAMPIFSWDFQSRPGIHHIGPMAQDFSAAFGLGADDRHIDLVDGVGVSLAAIQELRHQLKMRDAQLSAQSERIASLEAQQASPAAMASRIAAVEQAIAAGAVPHAGALSP